MNNHVFLEAYRSVLACYGAALEFFSGEDCCWFIPVLVKISDDLRLVAIMVIDLNHFVVSLINFILQRLTK